LLLCSDGLSGKVEDAEIWRLVKRSRSPQEACEQLVQAANDRGGGDNITVIIVQAQ
jgi:serine/threonine protein phosphatase PrpC